ncbi:epsin-2 [Acipenser ruthenus]|uniref:epsin-2 n=1 Tax=Acipenser ruthenus TaxID=7906 RepID=UPI0027418536|nr:epsin-2 [Acipenser ruthenus]XP_058851926.1 epsin-2 [Acipenser ruthenus]
MQTSSIRRQMKNVVKNYSEAEIRVREATSNDPWGPSSSLMTEIADLTYNVVAFSEIMSMIWKRLNDHGKNWRHVYKALTLLDYLIKTGSERVAQQCKENIFAIQTLKDFQYIDRDGKDQGINVREKSKQLVSLLKDDERLKGERSQALKTKERMAQVTTAVGSNNQPSFGRGSSQPNLSTSYSEQEYGKSGGSPASYHGSTLPHASSELEQARPQTSGEEELQLQLALAMSREAAEQEDRVRRGDDLRLQMALEESRRNSLKTSKKKKEPVSMNLMDALSTTPATPKSEPWGAPVVAEKPDPWGGGAAAAAPDPWQSYGSKQVASADPWGATSNTASPLKSVDPWAQSSAPKSSGDPWASGPGSRSTVSSAGNANFDPFSTLNGTARDDFSEFDSLRTSSTKQGDSRGSAALPSRPSGSVSPDLFDSQQNSYASVNQSSTARKTPESFLGPNAALVNLDSLISKPLQQATVSNPFLAPGASAPAPAPVTAPINPFQITQPLPPTLNQMRASPMMGISPQGFSTMPSLSIEPMPISAMAPPVSMSMVPMPSMPAIAPMGRMVPGVEMHMGGSMPQSFISTGIPPATAQAASTTNPFLL